MSHVIQATILTGCGKGQDVFIPRIPLIPSVSELSIQFKRLQFPVRVSFAMSINKAQGQTLSVTGLHLEESCFSHAQLYVGCSRVRTNYIFMHHSLRPKMSFKKCCNHYFVYMLLFQNILISKFFVCLLA